MFKYAPRCYCFPFDAGSAIHGSANNAVKSCCWISADFMSYSAKPLMMTGLSRNLLKRTSQEFREKFRNSFRRCSVGNLEDILRPLGYPMEIHECVTRDGFLLELHRIPSKNPGNRKADSASRNPPILLMHGFLASSAVFVISGSEPENALGLLFAKSGFDVWLGNFRGNEYSSRHRTLSIVDPSFWDFSWDEMGKFDLPAMIEYVLKTTESESLVYVGHSMGTTAFWTMAHHAKQWLGKVPLMVALAPVAQLSHMRSPIKYLAHWTNDIEVVMGAVGVRGFLPSSHPLIRLIAASLVQNVNPSVLRYVLKNSHEFITGGEDFHYDENMIPMLLKFFPAGASTRTLAHYGQTCSSKRFRQFDYGDPKENALIYGSEEPPEYDLKRVQTSVALFHGGLDLFSPKEDVDWLKRRLPKVVNAEFLPNFGHLDFHWGLKVRGLLFPRILEMISKFRHG